MKRQSLTAGIAGISIALTGGGIAYACGDGSDTSAGTYPGGSSTATYPSDTTSSDTTTTATTTSATTARSARAKARAKARARARAAAARAAANR